MKIGDLGGECDLFAAELIQILKKRGVQAGYEYLRFFDKKTSRVECHVYVVIDGYDIDCSGIQGRGMIEARFKGDDSKADVKKIVRRFEDITDEITKAKLQECPEHIRGADAAQWKKMIKKCIEENRGKYIDPLFQ